MDDQLKLADFGSCCGVYSKQPYTEYISTRWCAGAAALSGFRSTVFLFLNLFSDEYAVAYLDVLW